MNRNKNREQYNHNDFDSLKEMELYSQLPQRLQHGNHGRRPLNYCIL